MADVIREGGQLKGITTTNLWLSSQGIRWFCLLQPKQIWTHSSRGGQPITFTNWFTEAHLYPKPAVEQAFLRVLASVPSDRKALFSLAVALEKRGKTGDAKSRFRQYLALDPDGEWADAAREHLDALERPEGGAH